MWWQESWQPFWARVGNHDDVDSGAMQRNGLLGNCGAPGPFSLQADLHEGGGNFALLSASLFELLFHFDVSPVPADGGSHLERGGGELENWHEGQLPAAPSCWSARLGPSGDHGSETPWGGSLSQRALPRA